MFAEVLKAKSNSLVARFKSVGSLLLMDPLTQASIGAAAAALVSSSGSVRRAIFVGAIAGAAPDIDVLIRSETDPMLALEYHRHFTHALICAPVIGLLVAGLLKGLLFWKKWRYRELALFGIVGALTHGMLDACTSYGTLLYLPFSNHRESWDIISIIDPLFTLPLVLLTAGAFVVRKPAMARWALFLCGLYFCFGVVQRERAQRFAAGLAAERGHLEVTQLTARPSFGNTLLWRIVYRVEGRYYVDAVQLMPFEKPKLYAGSSVDAFTVGDRKLLVDDGALLAYDVERFRFFSQDYLYQYAKDQNVIGDLRYAMYPNSTQPLWGLRIDLEHVDEHAEFVYFRDPSAQNFKRLWDMVLGRDIQN